ncbi:EAL domain-containing protein [Blautia pseudococcoides]|uniref:bifunctional diguanylate cyclase/phosphodiesterase n=1 Tax=Blautia pseudococcoides TaxID=1796616 RepID=UPI00148B280E|nr:EAL domain-containing protein [Blautia pseudococcoides]QJU13107.1 EAL domain-containing protein [Blautia pseudococcoides]
MEHRELWQLAATDSLTGVSSRREGKDRLELIVKRAKKENKMLTVAMFDLNSLNWINNRYGDKEGDKVLQFVTSASRRCLRPEDVIFRLSSDEFIVAFYGEERTNAETRIQKITEILESEHETYGLECRPSFSYGAVEIYPEDCFTVSDIITKADELMYMQKRNYHIMRAKNKLKHTDPESASKDEFQYNQARLYDALIESTDDYIFIGNMKTGVFRYPPATVAEFGLPGEVVENAAACWSGLIHPHDETHFLESNQEIADGRVEEHNIEYRARNTEREWIWLRCRGKLIRDKYGNPDMFAGIITNLGKEKQIDHMTGLYNRFEFEGSIKKYLMDGSQITRIGIMILDMDAFKNVNDLYDRMFGDEILRITAASISAMLSDNARVYRLDGDEFGIIITNGSETDVQDIFAKIQGKYTRQQEYNGKKYYCTISGGYAACPDNAENYLELLKCANYALERSKALGKNRMTIYSPEIPQEKEKKLEMVQMLRESIERGFAGFSVCYQPQVDAKTGKLYGAEALARWHCSKYGDVPPGEFIPLLEQNGLIVPMGMWILRKAAAQCKEWCEQKPDFNMSVNLSYQQFLEGDLTSFVKEILKEMDLAPFNLTLELTESYFVKEDAIVRETLESFRAMGVQVAMDDFGVGYSSLFMLKHIPADIVKIDRGFVKGITTDLFNATFIRSITELCNDVGKQVCLEGVETKEEYGSVSNIGLRLIQGFYFGRPVPADKFYEKLKD